LVDEGPAEVGADEVAVAPAVEGVEHGAFAAAEFEDAGVVVYEL
jgi:hypothetical protein